MVERHEPTSSGGPGPRLPKAPTHYSGILIVTSPQRLERCAEEIAARFGVDVRHRDPDSGRLVAVLEAPSIERLRADVAAIRSVSGVVLVEPVNHFVDHDNEGEPT